MAGLHVPTLDQFADGVRAGERAVLGRAITLIESAKDTHMALAQALLQRLLPDWQEWDLKILATDINDQVLQRARSGTYGEWSFRRTPDEFRHNYFNRAPNGRYTLTAPIRRCVIFRQLNLARDPLPFEATAARLRDEKLIADLTVVEIENGPHNVGWTFPEEVNSALLDFLGR